MPTIEDFRDRPATVERILQKRLDTLLPELMRETKIDTWLVIAREYNDDPVYKSLVPDPTFTARRTTMLLFHRVGETVERLSINRYPLGPLYEVAWQGGNLEEQWRGLAEILREKNPGSIAINTSEHWPVADGLSHGLYQQLVSSIGPELSKKLVSSEDLVIRWIETRTEEEIELWGRAVAVARGVIAEAFSDAVVTPGVTTNTDLEWFMRQRFEDLGLRPWFQPYVNIQRKGLKFPDDAPFFGVSTADTVIRRGDILHTDVGICYLRLCTDTQEMGYVLGPTEKDVPAGLKSALAVGNRWQDILTDAYKTGRSGNEILKTALKNANKEDIISSVYTHPLGLFGHAPGPTIGMWDNQGDTPVRGDWSLYEMTGYAIEGNVKVAIPEYDDQLVQIKLEQSAWFDGTKVHYLAGRQTHWHVVK
ncbi:MAG: M24 family metallopeptidase [Pseudomonadota bacterium]